MKYNILINQKAIIDNGWTNIKANHIAVLEVIRSFSCSNTCQKLQDENGLWFWVNPSLIIAQIPMFDIKERRCQSLMKDLNDVNLIELNPNNRSLRRTYLRMGKSILSYDNYQENRTLQNNASTTQNNASEQRKILQTSMQNIADNNSINNNNINNNIKEEFEIKDSKQSNSKEVYLFSKDEDGKGKKVPLKKEKLSNEVIFPIVKKLSSYFPEDITKRLSRNDKLKWSETVEKLIRLDEYTKEQIERAVEIGRKDNFWKNNFLSITKLRKKDKQDVKYIQVFLNLDPEKKDDTGDGNYEHKPTEKPKWI